MLGATSDIKINLKCENLYFLKFKTSNENNYYYIHICINQDSLKINFSINLTHWQRVHFNVSEK